MFFARSTRRSLYLGIFLSISGFLVLSGCQQTQNQVPANYVSALTSQKGVQVERFLPQDTVFFIKGGTTNEIQQKNLQQVLQNFPQEDLNMLSTFIGSGFDQQFSGENITFQKDVLPALGKNIQAAVAFLNWKQDNTMQTVETSMMIFVPLAETEKFSQVLDTGLKKDGYTVSQYNNINLYSKEASTEGYVATNEPSQTYITLYQDVLIVANNKTDLQSALDRMSTKGPSFIEEAKYQKALTSMNDGLGFMFIDTPVLLKEIRNVAAANQTTSSSQQNLLPTSYADIIDSEMINISADNNGFKLLGKVYLNEAKAKELNISIQDFPSEPAYLYKKIPAENVAYFAEIYNLKKILETSGAVYQQMEGFKEVTENIKFSLALLGIDAEKDLLAFMDKGFAMVVRDGYWLIPGVDIYFDASSQPDGAKKVMTKFHDIIDQNLIKTIEQNQPTMANVITNKEVSPNHYRFAIDFTKLPPKETATIPKEMIEKGLSIEYGVNDNNLAYISLLPTTSTKTIADDESFKKAQTFIQDAGNGVSYFNPQALLNYINLYMAMVEEKGTLPLEVKVIAEKAKAYISPIKSIIFSSGKLSNNETQFSGYIYISK